MNADIMDKSITFLLVLGTLFIGSNRVDSIEANPVVKVKTFKPGSKLWINCFQNGRQVIRGRKFQWFHNGTALKPNRRIQIRRLNTMIKIQKPTVQDVGEYSCKEMLAGNQEKTRGIYIVKIDQSTLEFVDKNLLQQYIILPSGDETTLYCNATGTQPIRYKWYKNNKKIQGSNRPYLALKNLKTTDSATYGCKVKSKKLNIQHDFNVVVQERAVNNPYIEKAGDFNKTVHAGSTAFLSCYETLSGTLPDFIWLKWNGIANLTVLNKIAESSKEIADYASMVEIIPADRYKQVSKKSYRLRDPGNKLLGVDLVFSNVTVADRGFYTCLVSNHIGHDYKTTYLNVQSHDKPVIQRMRTTVFTTQLGVNFTFPECKILIQSDPLARITWEKSFSEIETSDRHIVRNSKLTIKNVRFSDSGYYSCLARNSAGEDQVRMVLKVWPLVMNKTSPEIITRLGNERVEVFCSAYGNTRNMVGTITNLGYPVSHVVETKKDNLFMVRAKVFEDGTFVCTIRDGKEKVQSASVVEQFHLNSVILNSTSIEHLGKWLKESNQLGRYKACWDTDTKIQYPGVNFGGTFFKEEYCGGKKNTITLIQIRDKWVSYYATPNRDWDTTLGGFTDIPWISGQKANSTKTFMFEFNPPKKYMPRFGGKDAICGYGSGPCFGNKNLYTSGYPPYAYGSRGNIWKIGGIWRSKAVFDILKLDFAQGYPRRMEVFYKV